MTDFKAFLFVAVALALGLLFTARAHAAEVPEYDLGSGVPFADSSEALGKLRGQVILSIRSYHILEKQTDIVNQDPNNNNYGLHYIAPNGFTIGAYRNSFDRNSVAVGYSFALWQPEGWGAVGMTVGGVSGYEKPIHKNPFFSFNYQIPFRDMGLDVPKNYALVVTYASLVVVNVGVGYKF